MLFNSYNPPELKKQTKANQKIINLVVAFLEQAGYGKSKGWEQNAMATHCENIKFFKPKLTAPKSNLAKPKKKKSKKE
jgi:hypothetical protein